MNKFRKRLDVFTALASIEAKNKDEDEEMRSEME